MSSGGNSDNAFTAAPIVTVAPRPATGALSAEDFIALNEEIAALAKAGLPLDQGLKVLAVEMASGRLKTVTERIADDLRAGLTLPQALEKQAGAVPSYYAALLNAGIRSGKLGEVLGTISLYSRSMADFRTMVASALLYPTIVLLLGVLLLAFVCHTILPAYAAVFREMRMKLPLATEVLLFIGAHPIAFLVVPPLGVLTGFVVMRFWLRRTPNGRMVWARFVNAVPIVGDLLRSARLAAFTDLVGILVEQSVPLPEALRLGTEASSDALLAEGGRQVVEDLRNGASLGAALHRQRLVPELIIFMVTFGERHGTLSVALRQLAQMYRRHAEVRAAFLRTVLPPLLILVLSGTLVFVFVAGVLGPMYELLDGLSGF